LNFLPLTSSPLLYHHRAHSTLKSTQSAVTLVSGNNQNEDHTSKRGYHRPCLGGGRLRSPISYVLKFSLYKRLKLTFFRHRIRVRRHSSRPRPQRRRCASRNQLPQKRSVLSPVLHRQYRNNQEIRRHSGYVPRRFSIASNRANDPDIDDKEEWGNGDQIACNLCPGCAPGSPNCAGICAFPQNLKKDEKVNGRLIKNKINDLLNHKCGSEYALAYTLS
jgi:hypothetical protein